MTINYANPTPVGKVRLLIADTDDANLILTDDQITGYLAIEAGHVKRAAAQALDAIASSEALVSKVIRTQDLQTNGAQVAQALHDHAKSLREQADDDDDQDGFDVVDFVPYPLTAAELTEYANGPWYP